MARHIPSGRIKTLALGFGRRLPGRVYLPEAHEYSQNQQALVLQYVSVWSEIVGEAATATASRIPMPLTITALVFPHSRSDHLESTIGVAGPQLPPIIGARD